MASCGKILILAALLGKALGQDACEIIQYNSDNTFELSYEKIEKNCYDIKVHYAHSNRILLKVEYLNLNGLKGDYLVIKAGDSIASQKTGYTFTYKLKKELEYLVLDSRMFMRFFTKDKQGDYGFRLSWKSYGEITTTPEITTLPNFPTPKPGEPDTLLVYIKGKNFKDIKSSEMINVLVKMSTRYCRENNVPLINVISEVNINISTITSCLVSWPDSNICARMRFAIPIEYKEDIKWKGYQLSKQHLEKMWNDWADEYLKEYHLSVFEVPDHGIALMWWLIIICSVVLCFCGLLVVLWAISQAKALPTFRKTSITKYLEVEKNQKHQVVPPIIDLETSNFAEYDPDIGAQDPPHSYGPTDNTENFMSFNNSAYTTDDEYVDDNEINSLPSSPQPNDKYVILQNVPPEESLL